MLERYENLLNPELLKPTLLSSSIFIAVFQSLRSAIVDDLRGLFVSGFDGEREIINSSYKEKVLSLDPSPVRASLLWFREAEAITASDIDSYNRARICRNKLAHELLSIVAAEGLPGDFEECFEGMVGLIKRIGVWWAVNIEIPTNPDFDEVDVDPEEVVPGRLIGLQILCDVALGSDERSRFWYEGLKQRLALVASEVPNRATE
jgi:hypothetical protein